MDVFTVYYADGSTSSVWDNLGDVVAVVVFGSNYVTQTPDGPVTGVYKTLHYQDEDEPGQFYFWLWYGRIYSGFAPKGTKVKLAAPLADYDTILAGL